MISIIISSAQKKLLADVSKNVETTIGVPYELIAIDNSKGEMGICQVYNHGAELAKYDLLCFMHEDIDIKTQNWGNEVLSLFEKDPLVGIVGVVGCAYKTFAASGWAAGNKKPNTIFANFIQTYKRGNRPSVRYGGNSGEVKQADVVCVDGMWFCTLKRIALESPFDQNLLTGFHCYDLDFCLNIQQKYKVVVTYQVLMEHYSEGGYSEGWIQDTLRLHRKWEDTLPRSTIELPTRAKERLEKQSYKEMLERMAGLSYSFRRMSAFLASYYRRGKMNIWLYVKLLYYARRFSRRKNGL
ncbi:hypothetical protein D3C87_93960 [compost metagenome]